MAEPSHHLIKVIKPLSFHRRRSTIIFLFNPRIVEVHDGSNKQERLPGFDTAGGAQHAAAALVMNTKAPRLSVTDSTHRR